MNCLAMIQGRRQRKSQAGQALVELAFMAPILVLLLIGVIEIGRYAYISILVGNAARAGAAYGSRSIPNSGDGTGISNAANNDFLSNGMTGLTTTATTTCGCDIGGTISSDTQGNCNPSSPPACSGHWVVRLHVTSTGQFDGLFKFVGASNHTITETAHLRVALI